jgi:hypothetical protein
MNSLSLLLVEPPKLSDAAASEMLDLLYELTNAFENHYANRLRHYHEPSGPPEPDLFEDFDDQSPPF